ncbi:MAG TPA: hypothetical protein PK948_00375 [Gemmatimonadales bacterium]|jgi:hypothetical protein|nr:hypothetical protein [Gemmatimonadales bacterium]
MCRPDRLLLAAALLCLIGSRPAFADPGRIQAAHPAPQDIPPAPDGGLTISLRDLSSPTRLEPQLARALRDSKSPGFAVTVPGGIARIGNYSIGSGESHQGDVLILSGDADLFGRLTGNLVTVDGDITLHPGSHVSGSLLAYGGQVRQAGGLVTGDIYTLGTVNVPVPAEAAASLPPMLLALRNVAGLAGIFLTLLGIGFGLVLLGKPNLEIISDTVSHTFGRSFAVGLLAQVLAVPTFGVLILGLILSVIGILLVPFAVVASVLAVAAAVLAGWLAVAHAIGETYTRRRLAQGVLLGTPNSYRYIVTGLVGMLLVWVGWAAFGWVPVLGWIAFGAAALVTWVLLTVGLGAALLSRLGLAGHFAGRLIPPEALTDEYLWATPQFGVPAARRPGQHKTPPPVR